MKDTACFDAATFQRLLAGQLTAAEVEAVCTHLDGCEHCAHTVRALPDQTISDALRVAGAGLDHPSVGKIYAVGEQDGSPFVVRAFVEGASLADRLAPGRRIKERDAVTLTVRIGEGLLAVHGHGIIHRDLKPANILMGKN